MRATTVASFMRSRPRSTCRKKSGRAAVIDVDATGKTVREALEEHGFPSQEELGFWGQENAAVTAGVADGGVISAVAKKLPGRFFAAEKILALAMARHARLGMESPARILTKDALRRIFDFVKPQEHLVCFGGEFRQFVPPWTHSRIPLSCVYDLDLNSGRWTRLADMPARLVGATAALIGDDVWLMGGRVEVTNKKTNKTSMVCNLDAYILTLKTGEWSVEENVLGDEFQGADGVSVVGYKNLCLCFGGVNFVPGRGRVVARDVCFRVDDGAFVELPPRPYADILPHTKALLVGSCVVVLGQRGFCTNVSSQRWEYVRPGWSDRCCTALHYLDLDCLDHGWRALPVPLPEVHFHTDVSFWLEGSILRLGLGSHLEMTCPCCGWGLWENRAQCSLDLAAHPLTWTCKSPLDQGDNDRYDTNVCVWGLDGGACVSVTSKERDLNSYPHFMNQAQVNIETPSGSWKIAEMDSGSDFSVDEQDFDERPVPVERASFAVVVYDSVQLY